MAACLQTNSAVTTCYNSNSLFGHSCVPVGSSATRVYSPGGTCTTGYPYLVATLKNGGMIAITAGPCFSFHDCIPSHNPSTALCSSFKAGDRGPPDGGTG